MLHHTGSLSGLSIISSQESIIYKYRSLRSTGSAVCTFPFNPYCQATTVTLIGKRLRGGIGVNSSVLFSVMRAGPSLHVVIYRQATVRNRFQGQRCTSGLHVFQSREKNVLAFSFRQPVRDAQICLLHGSLIVLIARMTGQQPDVRRAARIVHPHPIKTDRKRCIIHLLHRTTNAFQTNLFRRMFARHFLTKRIRKAGIQMKRQPIFFGQELQQHPSMQFRVIIHLLALLAKSLNTASFSVYVPCNAAR